MMAYLLTRDITTVYPKIPVSIKDMLLPSYVAKMAYLLTRGMKDIVSLLVWP